MVGGIFCLVCGSVVLAVVLFGFFRNVCRKEAAKEVADLRNLNEHIPSSTPPLLDKIPNPANRVNVADLKAGDVIWIKATVSKGWVSIDGKKSKIDVTLADWSWAFLNGTETIVRAEK